MKNEKLVKTAKLIDTILRIIQGFLITGAFLALAGAILMFVFRNQILASFHLADTSLSFGILKLQLAPLEGLIDPQRLLSTMILSIVYAVIVIAAIYYGLRLVRRIISPMKEGQPFVQGISKDINKLAWYVLIVGFLAEAGAAWLSVRMLTTYNLDYIFHPGTVLNYSFNFSLNFTFVGVFAIILLLGYIFRYGEELQQQADETL